MRKFPGPRSLSLAVASCCFAVVGFAALTVYVLYSDQSGQETRTRIANFNIAQSLASEIHRTLELYDLSLTGAIDALHDPDFDTLSPRARQIFLFDRAATATYLYSILVFDAAGQVRYDSTQIQPRTLDASQSEYFTVHRQHNLGLYVSRPVLSRLAQEWVIILSRRYNHPDGTFAGVVVGSLSLQYFSTLFDRMVLGPESDISLFRQDGTLIMRRPYRYPLISKFMPEAGIFQHYPQQASGWFTSRGVDDTIRQTAYSGVSNLPLVVTVGVTEHEILGDLPQKALLMGLALIGFATIMSLLMVALARAERQRVQAETELAHQVATDPLTGISNRRLFMTRLEEAWLRCGEAGAPLALLMIDVDHFKAYNDSLGHAAGDAALCAVAAQIASCCGPDQLVARYGGEEFLVLLPGALPSAAQALALRISQAVESSRAPHPGCSAGLLTVSVGVATAWPPAGGTELLMREADAALYEAKRRGRNCVWSAIRVAA